jgi:hypothetical protein
VESPNVYEVFQILDEVKQHYSQELILAWYFLSFTFCG